MANKLRLITDLYGETITEISDNPSEWMKFLITASNNYKYSFNDQVLIYAQRPEAKACADIDTWNRSVGRWINRGSKGIALISNDSGYTSLKYVFDVADTNSKYGKSFRLWSIPKPYENDVIESLENKYGELENKDNLAEAIKSVSKIIAEDNMSDYLSDLLFYRNNSALEEVSEEDVKNVFQLLLSNSIAYSMMNRCGINPNDYFKEDDFVYVLTFNSFDTINRLGLATSEISEMGLREIYSTVRSLRINEIEKIRTFENERNKEYDYNESNNIAERSDIDGSNNLYHTRGLPNSRSSIGGQESEQSSNREIRNDEVEISERTQETSIHNIVDERPINRAFDRDTESSRNEDRRNSISNEETREYNREIETNKSNEVGITNEQLEDVSRGDSDERINLRLNNYVKDESHRSFYVVVDEKINQIIAKAPHKKEKNSSIRDYFNEVKDIDERLKYLKNLFNNDYTGIMIDNEMFGYKTFNNGMLFWKGNFLSRDTESFVEWNDLIKHIDSMILLNQLNDRIDVVPIPMDEAVREVENRRLGVETNITNWQRRQNSNNNFSAVIPYDMEQQRIESKEFLDDLTTRDQRMFLSVLTMVHTADTKEQLDNDTESLLTTARKHLCQFATLKWQQMDGLNTAMPFGVRKIDTLRTLTTESLAVFMPFRVQEINHENGIYYGQNVISKNMIIADRRQLLNGNSFILGVSGSGKSFTGKNEIVSVILRNPNADVIVIDPEREYSQLINALGGEVIHISATSDNHINAMDMNSEYGDGANPVILKSEFILSLCEQLIGGSNLGPKQKSIIDRCTASVYRHFQQGNYMGTPPTLQDFREELLKQTEPEAKEIALAIELFTNGSLNTFAKNTNVDTENRLICYDILDLGKQLLPIGMLVVLDSILNRITTNRQKGRNTFIFIDEIYLLFQHEYSANFLFTLWKRVRKYGAYCTGITQNVDDLLQSHTARTMLANSEFIVMLNQASTDRIELAKLLNISELQMGYITNVGAGQGLVKVGSSLIPFINKFPTNTKLYKLMTTKPGEGK